MTSQGFSKGGLSRVYSNFKIKNVFCVDIFYFLVYNNKRKILKTDLPLINLEAP